MGRSIDDLYYGDEPDYSDELSAIENGGYDEMFPDELKDDQLARYIHDEAAAKGMSDLDYANQQDFFDEILDNDPENGDYIIDIEEGRTSDEFLLDKNGEPGLRSAREVYDELVSGQIKGWYGSDCKDQPEKALEDTIYGYEQEISDSQIGKSSFNGALQMLAKYKDDPRFPKCNKFYKAIATYADQINGIANSIGALDLIIDIPGQLTESKKTVKEAGPSAKQSFAYDAGYDMARNTIKDEDDICCDDDELKDFFMNGYSIGEEYFEDFKKGYDDYVTSWLEVPTGLEESKKSIKEAFHEGPGFNGVRSIAKRKIKNLLDKEGIAYDTGSQCLAYDMPLIDASDIGWSSVEKAKAWFAKKGLPIGFGTPDGIHYYGFLALDDEDAQEYLNQYDESKDEDDDDWSDLKADLLISWY